jgi:hypothetical protein
VAETADGSGEIIMKKYKERYGIPAEDVTHLFNRFYHYFTKSDFRNADDFVKWCSENGWQKGLRLCRYDTSKPHGPENSYFKLPGMTKREIAADKKRRKEERKNLTSPFCEGCQKECSNIAKGCEEYQKYFAKNWNENIRIAKPEVKEKSNSVQFFRYEHPDLVREGIVFEGTRSV